MDLTRDVGCADEGILALGLADVVNTYAPLFRELGEFARRHMSLQNVAEISLSPENLRFGKDGIFCI